jgi:hydroxymethylglutaryl-CoA synthase
MVGIGQYGAYIPRYRLARGLIAAAWGSRQPGGEIAVANHDEDALTLAVEAATSCLGEPAGAVDGVCFASTSSPFGEKQVASMLATACDLPRHLFTADFSGSARAGLGAMLVAARSVQAGAAARVLVAAADVRLARPESELEGLLGAGAAAVTLTAEDVIAELIDAASVSEEFTYVWRTDRSRTLEVAGGRFSNTYGYGRDLSEAIRTLLARQALEPADVHRVALYSPDMRASADLAKSLGFDARRQLVEPLATQIGCTGSAEAILLLARALDEAKPGEWILAGSYGEGADVLLFRTTALLGERRAPTPVAEWIAAKTPLSSYQKYLKFRRLLEVDEVTDVVTNVLEHQELRQDVRLYGSRCRPCGTVQYPMAHVCIACGARQEMGEVRLARRGTVFTYTVDHLIANLEHPLPMAVIDMQGGGRLYLQVADTDRIEIGAPVVLTYRRLHQGGGNYNYYWKARPERQTDGAG